ncbi:hypothetical protein HMPREF9440_01885 [Sutterella parvirubra YIT 11816]|uniref:Uncharacterized protein n=1 Tax=Sutterella parvirubra YIT 11816 TaxID=762967 RepID=H3KGK5_9BURK|nr:hypothetical protein HMPREF9440_01885 [Sutterella parvirubra YIT 11816]
MPFSLSQGTRSPKMRSTSVAGYGGDCRSIIRDGARSCGKTRTFRAPAKPRAGGAAVTR